MAQNGEEEAQICHLRDKISQMELLGRCIFHEENKYRKQQALKAQKEQERYGAEFAGGTPECNLVKQKRQYQLSGLLKVFDWNNKQAINQYDKRKRLLKMTADSANLQSSAVVDFDCYEAQTRRALKSHAEAADKSHQF